MLEKQELIIKGEDMKLANTFNTDENERQNWQERQRNGKGFIRNGRDSIQGRVLANIPEEEAAALRTKKDLDWLMFEERNDKNALKRLLGRFPWWKVCDGEV